MKAACENCGKLGDMTPGVPYVCGVCGYRHDVAAVSSRIAAASRADADRIAAEKAVLERKDAERRARERLLAALRPKTILPPRHSPVESVKAPPRRIEPYTDPFAMRPPPPPPPPRTAHVGERRSAAGGASALIAVVKALLVVAAIVWFAKSCLFSARNNDNDQSPAPMRPVRPKTSEAPCPRPTKPKANGSGGVRTEGTSGGQTRAVWKPGMRHPKQPHIYALEQPGRWAVEPGYELVHPGTDDWSVRKIPVYANCRKCSGAGFTERNVACPTCRGRRTVKSTVPHVEFRNRRRRLVYPNVPCPTCRGAGRVKERRTCPACNGQRVVPAKGAR